MRSSFVLCHPSFAVDRHNETDTRGRTGKVRHHPSSVTQAPDELWGERCHRCGGEVSFYSPDGRALCREHGRDAGTTEDEGVVGEGAAAGQVAPPREGDPWAA